MEKRIINFNLNDEDEDFEDDDEFEMSIEQWKMIIKKIERSEE